MTKNASVANNHITWLRILWLRISFAIDKMLHYLVKLGHQIRSARFFSFLLLFWKLASKRGCIYSNAFFLFKFDPIGFHIFKDVWRATAFNICNSWKTLFQCKSFKSAAKLTLGKKKSPLFSPDHSILNAIS